MHPSLTTHSFKLIVDPEYDSSDGDEENEELETISTKPGKKNTKRKNAKDTTTPSKQDDSNLPSTVIYLGHLPIGFEEREITIFLNQFGSVSRCRVSRSKKTGRSRGYAFVEFTDAEVAKIVSETMSGYFLLEKRLVCHVLPRDKVHELMFAKGKVKSKKDLQKKARMEVNKRKSVDVMKGITAKLVQREEMKRKKLAALGIDYDFPGYAAGAEASTGESEEPSLKRRKVDTLEEGAKENDASDNGNEMKAKPTKSHKKKKESKLAAADEEAVEERESKTPARKGKRKKAEEEAAPAVSEVKISSKKKKTKTPKKSKN